MKFEWLNEYSRKFLEGGYLSGGETGEERVKVIADNAQRILVDMWKGNSKNYCDPCFQPDKTYDLPQEITDFSDKFYDYMSRGYYSLASPIWANFGKERGLPISCFGSVADDSCDSILETNAEIGKMTQMGGGTSAYLGLLRERGAPISKGGESEGPMSFLPLFEATAKCLKQSSVRRGQLAVYLNADHPDIMDFLDIRSDGHPIQDLNFGVSIPENWMQEMVDGDKDKRKVWGKILKTRSSVGYPYLFFQDNANDNKPQVYKDKDMKILAGNLCNEISLCSTPEESFVCVLSSMNIDKYDEWKDTDAVQTLLMFLDTVNEEFVTKTEGLDFMGRAHKFAKRQRALGLGVLGWHTYLQRKMIPFGSLAAMGLSDTIFKFIDEETLTSTKKMADWFGEPELLKGYGVRNTTRITLPPTQSSSFLLGQVSPSIQPIHSNYFIDDKAKMEVVFKNPELVKILDELGKNTRDVWDSIKNKDGSVQHLDFLTDNQKEVFKKYSEISQMDIIKQASIRQKYIDQGQSLNLLIHPDTSPKDISNLHIEAWKLGLIGLYYQKSINAAVKFNQSLLECSACGG